MDRLIILTNSPGEVSGWVKPVCEELMKRRYRYEILLAVLPCPYASGMEESYGAKIIGVTKSIRYQKIWNDPPQDGRNLILQLGGDPFFGWLLSKKMKCDHMIYTSRPKFISSVKKFFLPDNTALARFEKKKLNRWKYAKVGNLILDSVPQFDNRQHARNILGMTENEHTVIFLPGSRPFEYKNAAPFFAHAAQELLNRYENLSAIMAIAPTVDEQIFRQGFDKARMRYTISDGKICEILINNNKRIKIIRDETFAAIKAAELAIALPGTNNLQIAMLKTPLLMVAPLNYAEEIPLDGIAGLIPFKWPVFRKIKKKLVLIANRKFKFISLPNRIANEMIVPEYRCIMTPLTVAQLADELIAKIELRENIIRGYEKIDFERGAAKKIVNSIEVYFGHTNYAEINLNFAKDALNNGLKLFNPS